MYTKTHLLAVGE